MNEFMKQAIEEAEVGIQNGEGGPFGCIIVKNGKIVAKAHNQVIKNNDATCHAEIQAIRMASKNLNTFDLTGCELYCSGEPCIMCASACLWANIQKVYYACSVEDNASIGFRDKKFDELIYKEKMNNLLPMENIDRKEGLKLFKKYLNIKNKIKY